MNPLHPDGREPRAVAMCGDWHGNPVMSVNLIDKVAEHCDLFVHLGDFGFWRPGRDTDKFLSRTTNALERHGRQLVWLDGNHECFPALYELPVDHETGLRRVTDRIWHLPRGHRWEWSGKTWMALGGAHSVDRSYRVEGRDWWREEFLTYSDVQHSTRPGPVDVMVTHDAPTRADVPSLRGSVSSWPMEDQVASSQHRALLQGVVDAVRPSHLWHGHYHCYYQEVFELSGGGNCRVYGLDCDEKPWRRNVRLAGPDGAPLPNPWGEPD